MELNPLNQPLSVYEGLPPRKPFKKLANHQSAFKKNSLVSKSGISFKSFDHYVSESFAQSMYPKKNQEDLDLLYIRPEDIDQDILNEQIQYEEFEQSEEKQCCTRYFGPLNPGSMRASIFALMACALGAGSLTLPKALFRNCGLINGSFLLISTAIITIFCLNMLIKSSIKTNIANYSELVRHCFSERYAKLTDLIFVVYSFGTITGYQIIISQFCLTALGNFGMEPDLLHNQWTKVIQSIGLSLLITPIALQTSFYAFRHVSFMGVLSLIYATLVVICQAPSYMTEFWDSQNLEYFVWDWKLFTGFSTAVFSYTCTTVVLPIKNELINPVEYRIMKIFNRSVFIEMIIYVSIGVAGYLSLLNKTPDIILDRPAIMGASDIAIEVARIAIIMNLSISIPININPGRSHFFILIKSDGKSKIVHYLATFLFLYGSMTVSLLFPDILAAFSFLGGGCSVIIGITFPALMWIKVNEKKLMSWENFSIAIFAVFLTVVGIVAACLSFMQAMKVI